MKAKLLITAMAAILAVPAHAGFVNGDFETGTFAGWTKNSGDFSNGTYTYNGNHNADSVITSAGTDPYTNNNLNMVYSGAHSARINDAGSNYHFNTISQTVTGWSDNSIFFAWAAVMEEPSNQHPESDAPNFSLVLHDDTANVDLYTKSFNVYNAAANGVTWLDGLYTGSQWKYTNWQVVQLDTTAIAAAGHDLTLTLLAADCGWGGHGGYAYLDGFGARLPDVNPTPEPATLALLGLGIAGLGFMRRRKSV